MKMHHNNIEKLITEFFAKLPRKPLSSIDKVAVWMRVQNHIREKKVMAGETGEKSGGWVFFPSFKFSPLVVVALVVLLALSLVAGAANAAKGSLPGQTLYPVKRAVEKVEIVLATSDEGKVRVLSNHAKRRLAEVTILVSENKPTKVVAATLEDLKSTTKQVITAASGSDPELLLLNDARTLVEEQEKVLTSFENKVDQKVREAVAETIMVSRESLEAASSIQPPGGSVDGVSSSQNSPSSTPASTAERKAKPGDGILQSPIQIHDVSNPPEDQPKEPTDPVILPEPTKGF